MGCGASKKTQDELQNAAMNSGKGLCVPAKDPLAPMRQKDLEKIREEYFWTWDGENVPYVKPIPKPEFDHPDSEGHEKDMEMDGVKTAATLGFNSALDYVKDLFRDEDPFKDWLDMFPMCDTPLVAQLWRADEEFARQRIDGMFPQLIECWTSLPEKFPLTEEKLKGVLPDGLTLQKLLDEGRVFVCDYKELEDVPSEADRYACAPICACYLDDIGKLQPLAIQLLQDPAKAPILTPAGNPGTWLAARTHVQCADNSLNELGFHLPLYHLVMEEVYLSMRRQLHARHPINQILEPHFWYTMIINRGLRWNLMLEGGTLPRLYPLGFEGQKFLIDRAARTCDFQARFDVPTQIKCRNIEKLSKGYFWQNDALRLWGVLEKYLKAMVDKIYEADADVEADTELKAWVAEMIARPGEEKGCGLNNLPVTDGQFKTKEQLRLFLNCVIYSVTGGHASVNNCQFDLMGFIPNKPQTFRLPHPTSNDQEITDTEIAKALPTWVNATEQITLMHVLSLRTTDKIGSYRSGFFEGNEDMKPIIDTFKDDLKKMSTDIQARNKELRIPYRYLDPDQIAQAVSI